MERKKYLLINLPAPYLDEACMNPNLGLMTISTYLKKNGVDVQGLDLAVDADVDIPSDMNYYLISCMTPQFKWCVDIVKRIKSISNGAIVAGGPHTSTIEGRQDFESIGVDYIFSGRWEDNFSLGAIDAAPDWLLFDINNYKRTLKGKRAVHLYTMYGCPFNCYYCDKSTVKSNVLYRPFESVIKEIDFIIEKFGIHSFVIYDDIFTLDINRLKKYCKAFKDRGIEWRCWSRTDCVDIDKLSMMKWSGLVSITFGVESGSQVILDSINKKATVDDNYNALNYCRLLEIPVRCSLMYGNPNESLQTVDDTIKLVDETQPSEWNLAIFTPMIGSEFWNNPEKHKISFDKKSIVEEQYTMLNRFGKSGIGTPLVKLQGMTDDDFISLLEYFVCRLEEVCPRDNIQDTLQTINLKCMGV